MRKLPCSGCTCAPPLGTGNKKLLTHTEGLSHQSHHPHFSSSYACFTQPLTEVITDTIHMIRSGNINKQNKGKCEINTSQMMYDELRYIIHSFIGI